jgi:hypothetical protein
VDIKGERDAIIGNAKPRRVTKGNRSKKFSPGIVLNPFNLPNVEATHKLRLAGLTPKQDARRVASALIRKK